ncbi:YfhD family protein [Bacillus norwichensis]|uniref:YfhD family protein n=1 Tax=Bacillus norwichensis TaxID=2762217 RepID=A0ABR8VPJ1_9BACI|nr:YfhD family protein [Bacillus norwichensis]MBD8006673.1 YfhD family protein [Bacillus norwichensis]
MVRSQNQKNHDKNKQKLSQVPKQLKSDGRDIEFSRELADQEDLKALAKSEAADKRAKQK